MRRSHCFKSLTNTRKIPNYILIDFCSKVVYGTNYVSQLYKDLIRLNFVATTHECIVF